MKQRLSQETIALRATKEFADGSYVNLGLGIPTLCSMFLLEGKDVFLEAEQGILGYGPILTERDVDQADFDYVDAGARFFKSRPGLCFFDMGLSFDIIRGRHLDVSVLGGLEVSEKGDLANWTTTGLVESGGIGGGLDLAVGAKKVIVCMEHTTKDGRPRVVKQCTLPLTGKNCVDLLITDMAVIEVTKEGLVLTEVAPDWTASEVQELTEATLIVHPDLKVMAA